MTRVMDRLGLYVLGLAAGLLPVNAQAIDSISYFGDSADSVVQPEANVEICGCDIASCCDQATCCDDACDSACGRGGLLAGLLKPSDRCFDDFISPMINFVYFEDPRNLTELRPIFVNHWVPSTIGSNVSAGGSIQLYAAQFRIALTDRLSLIAVKDGFIVDETNGALGTLLSDGWADVTAGLKYNLIRDPHAGRLVSIGGTYELPIGSTRALQDIGDGEFHFFITGGQRFAGGNAHALSSLGYRLPVDGGDQSAALHWSNHFDVRLTSQAYLFTEFAYWHWTDDAANGAPLGVGGQDLFNLSVNNIAGNDLITENVGLKWKPSRNVEAGIAYEFPLTTFKDVINSRLQSEIILRY